MSTISAANISDGTDTVGTGYVVNGSAKAWVNFNGSGTIAVRDSLNVTSLTDLATGSTLVNLTSAFSNTNFAEVACSNGNMSSLDQADKTTTRFRIKAQNASGTGVSATLQTGHAMGDLA